MLTAVFEFAKATESCSHGYIYNQHHIHKSNQVNKVTQRVLESAGDGVDAANDHVIERGVPALKIMKLVYFSGDPIQI